MRHQGDVDYRCDVTDSPLMATMVKKKLVWTLLFKACCIMSAGV